MKKIIVIGGGPAGIMAALTAANGGAEVALWEPVSYTHLDVYKRQTLKTPHRHQVVQYEHTVMVREDQPPLILTLPD